MSKPLDDDQRLTPNEQQLGGLRDVEREIALGLIAGKPKQDICEGLVKTYRLSFSQADQELQAFEMRLKHMGLIA